MINYQFDHIANFQLSLKRNATIVFIYIKKKTLYYEWQFGVIVVPPSSAILCQGCKWCRNCHWCVKSFTPWKTFEICSDTCSTQIIFYWGDCLCIIDYSIDWLIYVFKLDNTILLKKHILFLVTSRNIMFGNIIWFAVILHISDNFDITCSLDIISPRKEAQLWPQCKDNPLNKRLFVYYRCRYRSQMSFKE
jgi:hypothetical protein